MGEAGRAGWEQTSTECRVKETRNRPSITNRVIHCLEGRLESLLYTHETAGPLPSGLLDNGCKLFFFFFLRVKALVYMQLFREAIP